MMRAFLIWLGADILDKMAKMRSNVMSKLNGENKTMSSFKSSVVFGVSLVVVALTGCSRPVACIDSYAEEDMRVPLCQDLTEQQCQARVSYVRPALEAVVALHDGEGRPFNGTGTVIEGGRVVTAAHVVDETDGLSLTTREVDEKGEPDWACHEMIPLTIIYIDGKLDLAILVPTNDEDISKMPAPLKIASADTEISRGDTVWSFGVKTRHALGVIYGVREDNFTSTIPTEHGDSGGPLVDDEGQMIGVLSGYYYDNGLSVFVNIHAGGQL
jgi:hypothetical protein